MYGGQLQKVAAKICRRAANRRRNLYGGQKSAADRLRSCTDSLRAAVWRPIRTVLTVFAAVRRPEADGGLLLAS